MAGGHRHLELARSEPNVDRRRGGGRPPAIPKREASAHASKLLAEIRAAERAAPAIEGGFDPRLLLRLSVTGLNPEDLRAFPGFEVVSQEDRSVVLLFTDGAALKEFRDRIKRFGAGESVARRAVIQAIDAVGLWRAEDRIGPSLAAEGWPDDDAAEVDVELWPIERSRAPLVKEFERWCGTNRIKIVGRIVNTVVFLFRCSGATRQLKRLLEHRDVRRVELPPQWEVSLEPLQASVSQFHVRSPAPTAVVVGVLDSGVVTGHPLLKDAVVHVESFVDGAHGFDQTGHGTAVAGDVVYGDIEDAVAAGAFEPLTRIASARMLGLKGRSLMLPIEEAVVKFNRDLGVRIFNLSINNYRGVYAGGHVAWLAATLDDLSRRLGILFTVSAGNCQPHPDADYPRRLLETDARILDPAPALNVLTVGAIARHEKSRAARAASHDPRHQPGARRGQPSPFTRVGPGACGSIKPDLVEYGGNTALNLATGEEDANALGELCLNFGFAQGSPFAQLNGTSHAAPKVAHVAARLLERYPAASANLLRALIVASARWPGTAQHPDLRADELQRIVGYGQPSAQRALDSLENRTVLMCEEELEIDRTHFFEIPLPSSFLSGPRRARHIIVAAAHTPHVRSTRVEYRASSLRFRLMRSPRLEDVVPAMTHYSDDELPNELGNARPGANERSKGSVQSSTFTIKAPGKALKDGTERVFLAVSRHVSPWAKDIVDEKEAYAVVVALEDESNVEARLYTEISVMLQARARARSRR